MNIRVLQLAWRGWNCSRGQFPHDRVDAHAMWRLLAIRISLRAPARMFWCSQATPLPALCWRPGAARIWRAATRCIAAAIALLTALSLVTAQDVARGHGPFERAVRKL